MEPPFAVVKMSHGKNHSLLLHSKLF